MMGYEKCDDTSPMGVFLVKSSSKGEVLLFRYPYSNDDKTKKESQNKRINKYAIINVVNDDTTLYDDNNSNKTLNMPPYTELTSMATPATSVTIDNVSETIGITDNEIANLFVVKPKLCGEKFELKVNDIRFVGHPMLLKGGNAETDLLTFNVVFALRANVSDDIVDGFHDLSKRIAIALSFEENRCGYLSYETTLMIAYHDDVHEDDPQPYESPYKLILEKSRLAKDLKRVYEEMYTNGTVHFRINRWIEISFVLPQKVYSIIFKSHNRVPKISPEKIQNCLQSLRPYHGLLLFDTQELLDSLPHDVSPAFIRVIRVANPIKNLLELSADADITLSQVFHIVSQLVYWAKASIIFPLCESNVYTIHPLAPSSVDSSLVEEFGERFPGAESLLVYLSEFSLGLSLSQWRNPLHTQQIRVQQVQIIIWMLQKRLVLQLHTYIFLVPLSTPSPYLTKRLSQHALHFDRPQSSMTDADAMDFSTGSSFPSEESLATSPVNAIENSSKSASEDDLSSKFDEMAILKSVGLSQAECEAILKVPAAKQIEDIKLFARLCPYFNGRHHIEDIMYYENHHRGVILALLDKFRDVLLTCQYEDAAVSELCPYDQRM